MSALIDNQSWSLNDRVEALLATAEYEQGLGESSAMVLVGDIYVLREEAFVIDDGWGSRHYCAEPGSDPI